MQIYCNIDNVVGNFVDLFTFFNAHICYRSQLRLKERAKQLMQGSRWVDHQESANQLLVGSFLEVGKG